MESLDLSYIDKILDSSENLLGEIYKILMKIILINILEYVMITLEIFSLFV